jgi:hypothetical protein
VKGKDLEEIRDVLVDCFDENDFAMLLRFKLDIRLDAEIAGDNFTMIVFNTLRKAEREGWLRELIAAAAKARPKRSDIQEVYRKHTASDETESESPTRAISTSNSCIPGPAIPGPEQFINALCQLTAGEFDSLVLFLGIPQADVGGADLRGRAVSVYQRVARPGQNRERNLLRLKSEIERLYPDAFTTGAGG